MTGGSQKPNGPSKPCQPVNDLKTLYSESISSPRRVLSRKNSPQPRGNSIATGAFTSSQLAAAPAAVLENSCTLPLRRLTSSSGSNSSTG
ncbi:Uncharacterised protein [Mycobacteroides abscessus subsp. abscessus]|nr:Uncharacterised protein [Mycobacteroides abscessus subsp. abscessus]